jgi:GT2 family glycosyltransferase
MTLAATIVIPTYRRPELLDRCLSAVVQQDFPADRYDIIVADDGDDPVTEALVHRWAARSSTDGGPAVRYLPVRQTSGPAGARNAAVAAADGEVIAFTDDDTIPDRHWLAAGLESLQRSYDAVGGRIVVPISRRRPTDFERDTAGLEIAEFATANCLCRREVLTAVGGFDEQFSIAWREDSDLHFRLLESGFRVGRASEAIVQHPVRDARWGVSLWQQRKSEYNALLYSKHPKHYRERIQGRPPIGYYVAVGTLMASVATRRNYSRLSTGAFACWALLTLRLIMRRLKGSSRAPAHITEMVVTSIAIPPLSIFWRVRGAIKHRVVFL